MNRRRYILCMVLLLAFSQAAGAKNHYFKHYGISDGLAHQTVYSAVQDLNGFMWFGTESGLSRFDGSTFKNYIHDIERPESLPDNKVNALALTQDGIIWVGTSHGLCSYDPVKDSFESFCCSEFSISGEVTDVLADKHGNLWVLGGGNIYFIDRISGHNRKMPQQFSPNGATLCRSGGLWVLGGDGVHLLDPRQGVVNSYPVLSGDEIKKGVTMYRVAECSDGSLLITTNNAGARLLFPLNGEVQNLFVADAEGNPIFIHSLLTVGDDEFWFGTESGIHMYKRGHGFTEHLAKSYEDVYSLSDNAIHMLFQDREGGIWAGSFFGGLNYLSADNTLLDKYLPHRQDGSIAGNVIREILPDSSGQLWVGTEDGGLCRFDPRTGEFLSESGLCWQGKAITHNVQSLMMDGEDRLWIGTFDNGIYVMDIGCKRIVAHYGGEEPSSGIPSFIVCIRKLSSGQILVGTVSGIYIYDRTAGNFSRVPGVSGMVHSIFEDSRHTIWIGTLGSGVYAMDESSSRAGWRVRKIQLVTDLITSISEDTSRNLWIATKGMGLYRYSREYGVAQPVLSNEVSKGLIVYQVVEGPLGYLWISTSAGLVQYAHNQGIVHWYTVANGLPVNQFNYNSSYRDPSGRVYLGTVQGMISFAPETLQSKTDLPEVYVTGLWIYNQDAGPGGSGPKLPNSIQYTDRIVLQHDQNVISLSFAAPSFSITKNLWYRYRLQGMETQWNESFVPKRVSYTKLPPGKYTFQVQSSYNSQIWEGEPTSLEIVVKAPFWKTRLAKILYLLAGIGIISVIVLSIVRRIKREGEFNMQKLKDEKDIEVLQSKIEFFTNITHEIRTPLTLINGSLNRIKRSASNTLMQDENIQIMDKNTQRLMDLVNQLLDFRKIELSALRMNFSRVDLTALLDDTCNRFKPLAEVKGVDFSLDSRLPDAGITADREAVTKILSNMLSNALKFCSHKVSVSLTECPKEGERVARVRVENDGLRIPEAEEAQIFKPFYQCRYDDDGNISKGTGLGLPLARSLAEMQNGAFYLDSSVQDMNSFVLDFPLEKSGPEELRAVKPEKAQFKRNLPLVLIVDDEEDVCRFIAEELSEHYNVLTAGNGDEALSVLDAHNVALVITDLMMPVMDGLTFCKNIKDNIKFCNIPVIVLTAKASLQAHMDVLESGADAYIEKPFSTDHLLAQVSNLLSNRDLMRSTFVSSPYAHLTSVASNIMDENFLEKMNAFVMDHLSDSMLSVDSLADHMNMSVSTLYRKVKSLTSLSPGDFIRLCRLKKAAELLSRGDMRINEVADQLRFASPSYFTSCFMKQFGITPSEFMKMNNRN